MRTPGYLYHPTLLVLQGVFRESARTQVFPARLESGLHLKECLLSLIGSMLSESGYF